MASGGLLAIAAADSVTSPSRDVLERTRAYLASKPDRAQALEDVLWALLNTREFVFQH